MSHDPPISSPLLTHLCGYIAGRWTRALSGATVRVHNPATGEQLAEVPRMGAVEATAAVEAGERAFREQPGVEQRRGWLARIAESMLAHKDELGRLITLEHGKPWKEAIAEAEYAAGFFRYFAGLADHLKPRRLPDKLRGCEWTVHPRPAGVSGLITPWNFPLAMMSKKIPPALLAGCPVVLKPAGLTPLSAIALCQIAMEAGVPPGWLNLVIGESGPIGDVFCSHPAVRVISFTGSTEVGQILIQKTAPHIKRLSLELGGNAPFLVFDDANLDAAAEQLVANKFRSGGQTCVCTNRVYVQQSIEKQFIEKLAPRVAKLKVGNGMEPGIDIGPLINRAGWDKVDQHVRDAMEKGAKRIVGEDRPRPAHDWGAFYSPTLLTGVTREMRVCREETFGPVVAVATFQDEADAIAAGNDTCYGLAAYVFSSDRDRIERVVSRLRFGHVGVNTGTGPTPEAPFGGMKMSGFGREGGVEGLHEYLEPQTTALA